MPVFEIHVPRRPRVSERKLDDAIEILCGALRKNGQAFGEHVVVPRGAGTRVLVRAPYADALAAAHDSPEVRSARAVLAALCARPVVTRRVDAARTPRAPVLSRVTVLALSTNLFDVESAVRGGRGERVPAYLLPIGADLRERLHRWTSAHRELDRIWIGSGALAIPAYRQLADPESELGAEGRAVAAAIEAATRIPTFYDLYRYHGRRVGEERRRCPLCGRPWRAKPRLPWLRFFEFCCRPCRLLSNVAYSRGAPEDERHAAIGEPRAGRSSRRTRGRRPPHRSPRRSRRRPRTGRPCRGRPVARARRRPRVRA